MKSFSTKKNLALALSLVTSALLFSCQSTTEQSRSKSSVSLEDVQPAGADDAIYVGDSQEKTLSIIKYIINQDKLFSTQRENYYARELSAEVTEYSVLYNNQVISQFYFTNDSLRSMTSMFKKIHKAKLAAFGEKLTKTPNTFARVKKGVFQHLASPNKEYITFMAVEKPQDDSINVGIISWSKIKDYDIYVNKVIEHFTNSQTIKGQPVKASIIE